MSDENSSEAGEPAQSWQQEVDKGRRFTFGRNWQNFLKVLNDDRILAAEESLKDMLEATNLNSLTFVDIGSGSGLFSLAARRLGAKVHSVDIDPFSVACTSELRNRYFPGDNDWTVESGSILDNEYTSTLQKCDIVYSWGVLHHTGNMWQALETISHLVLPGGKLFIALYNDCGRRSRLWRTVKKTYCSLPGILKPLLVWTILARRTILEMLTSSASSRQQNQNPGRGMTPYYDLVDWVGGYPYEVATPAEIIKFFCEKGFSLCRSKDVGNGLGNNEFVFHLDEK